MSEDVPLRQKRKVSVGAIGFSLVMIAFVGQVFFNFGLLMWGGIILSVIAIVRNNGRRLGIWGLITFGVYGLVWILQETLEYSQSMGP
jgi:hypothetical protein